VKEMEEGGRREMKGQRQRKGKMEEGEGRRT